MTYAATTVSEPYALIDPAGRIRAFADLAPLWVRRELYKMLLALRERPIASGPGYAVMLGGDLRVAQFLNRYAAL